MCVTCMPGVSEGQKMAPDPLEMELIKAIPVATVSVNLSTWEVEAGSKVHPRLCLGLGQPELHKTLSPQQQ